MSFDSVQTAIFTIFRAECAPLHSMASLYTPGREIGWSIFRVDDILLNIFHSYYISSLFHLLADSLLPRCFYIQFSIIVAPLSAVQRVGLVVAVVDIA